MTIVKSIVSSKNMIEEPQDRAVNNNLNLVSWLCDLRRRTESYWVEGGSAELAKIQELSLSNYSFSYSEILMLMIR